MLFLHTPPCWICMMVVADMQSVELRECLLNQISPRLFVPKTLLHRVSFWMHVLKLTVCHNENTKMEIQVLSMWIEYKASQRPSIWKQSLCKMWAQTKLSQSSGHCCLHKSAQTTKHRLEPYTKKMFLMYCWFKQWVVITVGALVLPALQWFFINWFLVRNGRYPVSWTSL